MTKIFLGYEQQIDILKKEKGLLIEDNDYAVEVLKRYSYYSLIGGYKTIFKNPTTQRYVDGTSIEDIVDLYEFDEELRHLFLKYLLKVEVQMKSLISYYFCEKYGELQSAYLSEDSYNRTKKNGKSLQKLIHILDRYANDVTDYHYINHAREKYGNVPLWVLTNALMFGSVSKMYQFLQNDVQAKISKNYYGVNEAHLVRLFAVVAQFRNICAHGERLYSYKTKNAIPDLDIHSRLQIEKKGKQYIYGKQDLFAVVISLFYLLPTDWFKEFAEGLSVIIEDYFKRNKYFTESEFLKYMGFPINWRKIKEL